MFRKGSTWFVDVRWRIGTRTGRYRRKVGRRQRDAELAEAAIRAGLAAGTWLPPEMRVAEEEKEPAPGGKLSFADFVSEHYLPWSRARHSPGHAVQQVRICGRYLVPTFGERALGELRRADVLTYMTRRRAGADGLPPVKGATVNRELATLKAIFRCAVELGILEASPADGVPAFEEPPNSPRLLSQAEVAALLDATSPHSRALVGCAVYAGLRRAELFTLEWGDVDLLHRTLTVTPQGERRRTKNQKARRIPIAPELAALLADHARVRRLDTTLVFPTANGGQRDKVDRQLKRAAAAAQIEGSVRLHQLRHAFCSHALMAGIDPRTVQGWMGHEDLTTTLRYAHTSPDHERQAIERLSYRVGDTSSTVREQAR